MARLIFASALDRQAKRHEWLRRLLFSVESAIVHMLWYLLRALSPDRSARLGGWLLERIGPHAAKHATVLDNLEIAFPDMEPPAVAALARHAWRQLGMVVGEYPHLEEIARRNGGARITLDDQCGLEKYVSRSRQAIFVGAHLSNWEVMALALAREGVPLLALYAPLQNPGFDELMARARTQLGCKMLGRGESMRALVRQVRDGGSIGLLLDLAVDDGIEVPFFGHSMLTSATPSRMAQRYDCDVIPVRTQRLGPARFHFTAYPPLALDRNLPGDEFAYVVTRQLVERMECWIRQQPEEWMSGNRRWAKALYSRYRG
jgi:KDO2-lipid IV(A) lauroyltransferase